MACKLSGIVLSRFHGGRVGVALALVRLFAGVAFIQHGWPKITDTPGFAEKLDVPVLLAGAAAVAEFGGGIFLILGLLTPVWSALLVATMFEAMRFHIGKGDPMVNPGGGSWELAGIYFVVFIGLLLTGPGAFSLDRLLFRKCAKP